MYMNQNLLQQQQKHQLTNSNQQLNNQATQNQSVVPNNNLVNTQNNTIKYSNTEYKKVFFKGLPESISDVFLKKLFEVRILYN
jgi:hypothetical protein